VCIRGTTLVAEQQVQPLNTDNGRSRDFLLCRFRSLSYGSGSLLHPYRLPLSRLAWTSAGSYSPNRWLFDIFTNYNDSFAKRKPLWMAQNCFCHGGSHRL